MPIGFAGGLHDRDLGFVRFGWRDYDVNTGRWTAPDPIGDKGGDPDWYGYCLDDPVNGVDPLGLSPLQGLINLGGQLLQYAPAANKIGTAVANEFMDGRPGYLNAISDGSQWYTNTVDSNLDQARKRRKTIVDQYRKGRSKQD